MKYSLRSLMRFSLRDLALVTVIVALALGWRVREGQLQNELARANRWRNAAGTLEEMLRDEGFDVRWQFDAQEPGVEFRMPGGSYWRVITSSLEPSPDHPTLGPMPPRKSPAPAPNPPKK